MKELRREKKETEDKLRDELKAGRKQNEEIRGLGKQELDARQAEIERLQQEVNKKACEQNRSSKAYDRLVAKVEEMKRQETAKTTLHNAALDKLKADNVKLQARFDKAVSEASSQRSRMEQDHAKLVMRQQTLHTDTLDKLKATVASKERIINQLSENNERRDVEVASLTTHDEEQAATIVRLQQEIAALTADAQKSTSVATSMRNASTATHHCASTQTAPEVPPTQPPPRGPKASPDVYTYQTAINHLQELLNSTNRGAHPAVPAAYPNYPMPLPFPHFTPNGVNGINGVGPPNPYHAPPL